MGFEREQGVSRKGKVPLGVMIDPGYEGYEALRDALGESYDILFLSDALSLSKWLEKEAWPLVLAPESLNPSPGSVLLEQAFLEGPPFLGLLLADEEPKRLRPGTHALILRPIQLEALSLRLGAFSALRQMILERG